MIALLVDLVVAGLLLATLSYCVLLNRRLAALRDDKGELRGLIVGLAAASQRAESGVASLRVAAEQIGVGLQEEIDRARELRDDLSYMIERGGALADRLEGSTRARRDEARPAAAAGSHRPQSSGHTEHKGTRVRVEPSAPVAPLAPAERIASFPSRVERDLRRVLEGRR